MLAGTAPLAIGPTIVKESERTRQGAPGPPVAVYMGARSVPNAPSRRSGLDRVVGIVGAALFMLSDACIGWSQFVAQFTHSRLAMTCDHLPRGPDSAGGVNDGDPIVTSGVAPMASRNVRLTPSGGYERARSLSFPGDHSAQAPRAARRA